MTSSNWSVGAATRSAIIATTVAFSAAMALNFDAGPAAASKPSPPSTVAPMGCPEEYLYDITSSSSTHLPASSTYYKDGPGGTMTVSVQTSSTISATASVSAGATISGLVAQAQVEVSASATVSKQITVGHQYSRDIASGKYGNMQYGSWGHTVSWTYSRVNISCSVTHLSSGSGGKIPNNAVGWRYWETSS